MFKHIPRHEVLVFLYAVLLGFTREVLVFSFLFIIYCLVRFILFIY